MRGEHRKDYCGVKKHIGCDAHALFVFASSGEDGKWQAPVRVEHDALGMERFLRQLPAGQRWRSRVLREVSEALPLFQEGAVAPQSRKPFG